MIRICWGRRKAYRPELRVVQESNEESTNSGERLQRLLELVVAEFQDKVVEVSSRGMKGFIGQHRLKLLVCLGIILNEKIIVTK